MRLYQIVAANVKPTDDAIVLHKDSTLITVERS
jgi:hypothetical protein